MNWYDKILLTALGLAVLFLPYAFLVWLAGGPDQRGLHWLFLFWPLALGLTVILLTVDQYQRQPIGENPWQFWAPGPITSGWIILYFSPIILNAIAKGCWWMGWYGAADFCFQWRWMLQLAIVLGLLLILVGITIHARISISPKATVDDSFI